MKKIIFSLILTLFVVKSFCQTTIGQTLSKDCHLQKSKNQKKAGWILLGSGLGIAAIGGIIQLNDENQRGGGFGFDFTGTWIAMGGGVVALSSIPFFISSAKNKRRTAVVSLSTPKLLLLQENTFAWKIQPALKLNIEL